MTYDWISVQIEIVVAELGKLDNNFVAKLIYALHGSSHSTSMDWTLLGDMLSEDLEERCQIILRALVAGLKRVS